MAFSGICLSLCLCLSLSLSLSLSLCVCVRACVCVCVHAVKGKHQLELTPKSVEIIVHGRFSACTDPEVRVMVKMGQSQHGFWTVLFLVCFIVSLIFLVYVCCVRFSFICTKLSHWWGKRLHTFVEWDVKSLTAPKN